MYVITGLCKVKKKRLFPKSLSVCDCRKEIDFRATALEEQRLKIHQTHGHIEG